MLRKEKEILYTKDLGPDAQKILKLPLNIRKFLNFKEWLSKKIFGMLERVSKPSLTLRMFRFATLLQISSQ